MQRFDEALNDFNAALALDPFHALGWNNLGTTYVAMKRFDQAGPWRLFRQVRL